MADDSNPVVLSCSEFSNIFPGVFIDAAPLEGQRTDFIVRTTGKAEEQLLSSFEDAMETAADLLKQELAEYERSYKRKN